MPHKIIFAVLTFFIFFSFMNSSSFALQSGGVEIGDLETGSVVGKPFTVFPVHATFTAMCVGGNKAWYSSKSSLNLAGFGSGLPTLIKVTNLLPLVQGFRLSADPAFVGPVSGIILLKVRPGESKYIGIPITALATDLSFVVAPRVLTYDSHTDSKMLGGQLVIQ